MDRPTALEFSFLLSIQQWAATCWDLKKGLPQPGVSAHVVMTGENDVLVIGLVSRFFVRWRRRVFLHWCAGTASLLRDLSHPAGRMCCIWGNEVDRQLPCATAGATDVSYTSLASRVISVLLAKSLEMGIRPWASAAALGEDSWMAPGTAAGGERDPVMASALDLGQLTAAWVSISRRQPPPPNWARAPSRSTGVAAAITPPEWCPRRRLQTRGEDSLASQTPVAVEIVPCFLQDQSTALCLLAMEASLVGYCDGWIRCGRFSSETPEDGCVVGCAGVRRMQRIVSRHSLISGSPSIQAGAVSRWVRASTLRVRPVSAIGRILPRKPRRSRRGR